MSDTIPRKRVSTTLASDKTRSQNLLLSRVLSVSESIRDDVEFSTAAITGLAAPVLFAGRRLPSREADNFERGIRGLQRLK
jgi:hypothetical protein